MIPFSPSILIAVAIGGALGAISRFTISQIMASPGDTLIPWATLLVNLLGAFLIGILFVLFTERMLLNEVWRALLMAGFLGSLTTFSTFSLELFNLIAAGQWIYAAVYMTVSVVLCLILVTAGVYLARMF